MKGWILWGLLVSSFGYKHIVLFVFICLLLHLFSSLFHNKDSCSIENEKMEYCGGEVRVSRHTR